jgi:hypothetical protein
MTTKMTKTKDELMAEIKVVQQGLKVSPSGTDERIRGLLKLATLNSTLHHLELEELKAKGL